ncbi:hypothetical protein D9756_002243 [Leucocoprinus leucothites]|uniref:HIT-type domain-containing protein n=1 Tax=Leucocoprinus leucothites TaxID=201217 RepID=A0A8H5LM08_9AGAR|nr:hypothetical protein D9756_002243 [Leucoagaricus leucothites]
MSSQEIHTLATAASQDDDGTSKAICRLCRRQFAKYTCPTCNVPYCSLVCFRSSPHSQCSETFYKKELQSDITTTPSHTHEERKQMMELLKRFEETATEDEHTLYQEALGSNEIEDGGADKEMSLVDKFAGLDLDSISSEDMWKMLTSEEREKFVKALEDPISGLAQRLSESEQLEIEIEQPWWIDGVKRLDHEQEPTGHNGKKSRPTPICIPQSMVKPVPPGQPLVYNLTAICIAYSYIVRHLGVRMLSALPPMTPDFEEALRLIDVLVPFLLDRRSTILHDSVGAAITDVYSRFEMGKVNSELFAVLLEDTTGLMKPLRVMPLSSVPPQSTEIREPPLVDLSAHSLLLPILVLSDLIELFQSEQGTAKNTPSRAPHPAVQNQLESGIQSGTGSKSNKIPRYQHVIRKLEFYVAHILATPSRVMESVSDAALQWSHRIRAEGQSVLTKDSRRVERVREPRRQLVEEIAD